jgi:3-deoxy-D-manno-octulosonic-acid transferase
MDHYRAADVALVGGSLVPIGGHNPLEPAAFGAAIVVGPHHASQHDAVAALAAHAAIAVASAPDLATTWGALLADPGRREAMGRAALAVAAARRGAAARTRDQLVAWKLWPA